MRGLGLGVRNVGRTRFEPIAAGASAGVSAAQHAALPLPTLSIPAIEPDTDDGDDHHNQADDEQHA